MSFIDEITDLLQRQLSLFPLSRKVAEDLDMDEEIRILPHGNYNSYYRVIEEKQLVEVMYIFNGSRDIQELMAEL